MRFLNKVKDHPVMKTSADFSEFLNSVDYSSDVAIGEATNLEEDTSTVSKYVYSWWDSIKNTVTGTNANAEPRNAGKQDFEYQKDLQKCQNLLDFVERLYNNSNSLRDLLNDEYENTRNIGTVMGSLKTSIGELDGIKENFDSEVEDFNNNEEEKKIDLGASNAKSSLDDRLKESTDNMNQENKNDKAINEVIISMEEGIDILKSSIDAIERRNKYKKAIATLNEEIANLNSIGEESNREKEQKEKKVSQLSKDLERIDENLETEIKQSIETIERKTQTYISKLVNARKTHLSIQKDKWANIAAKYSNIYA